MAAVRESRVACSSLGRHNIDARSVFYVAVRAVWNVFHIVSVAQVCPCVWTTMCFCRSSATLFPRGTSVVGTFGRCGTTCIRLTSFPTFSPCRSTRVVEGLAWERTPAPPLGALPAHIKGPGRRYTGVCVELTPGSPLSRGVSRCRSARPRYRYLRNGCCIRGGVFLHYSAVGHELT